jgi:hypothetical protein
MSRRLLLSLAALAIYSITVLGLDSFVLPAFGINGFGQITETTITFLAPPQPARDIGTDAAAGRVRPSGESVFRVWLRPFGVHTPGPDNVLAILGAFAALSIIAASFMALVPERIRYISGTLRAEGLSALLTSAILGLVALIVGYAVIRLSWLTIVGALFIPLLITAFALATMLGVVSISFGLGRGLFGREDELHPLAELALGFWVLFLTGMLPYLGWVVTGAAVVLGLGLVLQTRFGSIGPWSLDALREQRMGPHPDAESNVVPLRRRG